MRARIEEGTGWLVCTLISDFWISDYDAFNHLTRGKLVRERDGATFVLLGGGAP